MYVVKKRRENLNKFNDKFIYYVNNWQNPSMVVDPSGLNLGGDGWYRKWSADKALYELSYGQHASADPSIHAFQTWIGDHYQWEANWGEENPMVNAEQRIDSYVEQNGHLPLVRGDEVETSKIIDQIDHPLSREQVKDLWDNTYGGYELMAEKYSNENLQKMLNQAIDDSKKHLKHLNDRTNGDLRKLLVEAGCFEDPKLK
ncbi:MAG: hypothetical protein LIP77_07500 [Planctomycetes bacterium]|nr:hypothetical protein [Planctomycetota bacterium]